MTRDELSAHVQDVLIRATNTAQAAAQILTYANGADVRLVLTATLDYARELRQEVTDLQLALEDSESERKHLEEDIADLRARIRDALEAVEQAPPSKEMP